MSSQFGSIHSGTSRGSVDPSLATHNRQVSLANIATAFLTERKSSSRRQSSIRRKKRQQTSITKRQLNYTTAADEILSQRLSAENMEAGIATVFVHNGATTNGDNKHRSTMLTQEDHRLLLSSSEWVEDVRDSDPYVSILNRLGEAIQDSETYFEFVKKSFSIISQTFLATALLFLVTIFQVILFFIGVKYLNDCPRQQNLPVYLLVIGSMGLVRALNLLWKQFRRRRMRKLEGFELDQEEETENDGSDFTDAVLNLFLLAWFAVGQYWIWSVYLPNFEFGLDNPENYCHRNVYVFALVHIGFVYVMFLATIFFLVALTCCARFPHLIVKTPR